MNVASREISEELYKVSEWDTTLFNYYTDGENFEISDGLYMGDTDIVCPAYDAGFLLRKLPPHFNTGDARGAFEFFLKTTGREWFSGYNKPELGQVAL